MNRPPISPETAVEFVQGAIRFSSYDSPAACELQAAICLCIAVNMDNVHAYGMCFRGQKRLMNVLNHLRRQAEDTGV